MKILRCLALAMLLSNGSAFQKAFAAPAHYDASWSSLDQRPMPQWFLDAKFGVFIHWGVYSVPAWGAQDEYAEWYWHHIRSDDPKRTSWWQFHKKNYGENFDYMDFAPRFTAELFDARAVGGPVCARRREICGADLQASRRLCPVAERRGQPHLGPAVECRGDRAASATCWASSQRPRGPAD